MFCAILNCNAMKIPFKYLGMLVGVSKKRYIMGGVLDKIRNILDRWKCGKFIFMTDKLCLIKSVLSSLSILLVFT